MRGGSVHKVLLSVEKPVGHTILLGLSHDRHNLVNLLARQLTSALRDVDTRLLGAQNSVPATDTLDAGESKGHRAVSIEIRVVNTKNVQKFLLLNHQRLKEQE